MSMDINQQLKLKLKNLPHGPGVYQFISKHKKILYVGKAKNLANRVRSYFNISKKDPKTSKLVDKITDLKYTTTKSELEALVLETNFIKQYRPPYNVLMRDDKNYLYAKISLTEDYPTVELVRRVENDRAEYFGPFINTTSLRQTLKTLKTLFGYRICQLGSKKPCLDYHLGRCRGACIAEVTPLEYRDVVTLPIINFFKGNHRAVIDSLQKEMNIFAGKKMFEQAATVRDRIKAISEIDQKQTVSQATTKANLDIIGRFSKAGKTAVQLFRVRLGKLLHQEQLILNDKLSQENLGSFIAQYYKESANYPKEIIVADKLPDQEVLEMWLTKLAARKVKIAIPARGVKRGLLKLATDNARTLLGQELLSSFVSLKPKEALSELAKVLNLKKPPKRIEAFDISHLGGTETVGSMTVMTNGRLNKKEYRRFKIRTLGKVKAEIDDYKALAEVLQRRFMSLMSKPDLVLIDGGKGQLNAVKDIVPKSVLVISIAKREEEVFRSGQTLPLNLKKSDKANLLLQQLRDEAHRLAIGYHRLLRKKKSRGSLLDDIPGIGAKRKKELLRHFGSLSKLREAHTSELKELVGAKAALNLKKYL